MEYESSAGEEVPALGFGTWQMDVQTARESVESALETGYRHIDTAQAYNNEAGVARGIENAAVDREAVFLTTKVHPRHRSAGDIVASVKGSLTRMGLDRVDLLLIHWPNPLANLEAVVNGLNEARERGLTRHIGVSNFGVDRLDRARKLSEAPIFTNQVLFHPWYPQRELLRYCQDEDVLLTAYSPLATGEALDDDVLRDAGRGYGKSPAQVALRWAVQHENVMTIPRSTSRQHIAENFDIFDFKLSRAEHDRITRPSKLKTGLSIVKSQLG